MLSHCTDRDDREEDRDDRFKLPTAPSLWRLLVPLSCLPGTAPAHAELLLLGSLEMVDNVKLVPVLVCLASMADSNSG